MLADLACTLPQPQLGTDQGQPIAVVTIMRIALHQVFEEDVCLVVLLFAREHVNFRQQGTSFRDRQASRRPRLLQGLQPFVAVPSDADQLLYHAAPDTRDAGKDILVGAQTSISIVPVGGTRYTLLQIRAPLLGCQQRSDVLLFHKMHARLHAIDRSKIKSSLGSLRIREVLGQITGTLRRLLELCE